MLDKNLKIYIAGHKGLVGSAIYSNLQAKGYTNIIGRTSTELNLLDSVAVDAFFKAEQPDCVFLAAAKVGGIVANNKYRADFIYENLVIQNNVIGSSFKYGVKKLLFLGSTCIYPRDCQQPIEESSLLTDSLEYTNEPYAIAKIAGLKMCESFNIQYGTNYIAVMPTNLYGPNDNFDLERSHVLPALVRKILLAKALIEQDIEYIRCDLDVRPVEGVNGSSNLCEIEAVLAKYGITKEGVEIWGTGKPMREFLWSEDMADACVYIMQNVDFSDLRGEASEVRNCHINIGTGKEISIADVAKSIADYSKYSGKFIFDTNKPDGTMRKLTDVKKLHSLGWHHRIEIDNGVGMMVNYYNSTITRKN